VFVDHFEQLKPPAIGRGVEFEVQRPVLVRVLSLVTSHRAVGEPYLLSLPGSGPLQAFLPPEPLPPLVITVQPSLRNRW